MLSFFPSLYPDELLYSIVARYHKLSGNCQIRHTKQELFDSPGLRTFVLVPERINILAEKLTKFNITRDQLLYNHTFYPYLICFCKPNDKDKKIPDYSNFSMNAFRTYTTGIVYHTLRYCPLCVKEDQDKYGESYWHRCHQVEGNRVCHKHGCCLEDSGIVGSGQKEFITLEDMPSFSNPNYLSEYQNGYMRLDKDIEWVMNHYSDIMSKYKEDEDYFEKRNTGFLYKKGLTTLKGRIRQDDLKEQFHGFIINQYGQDFYNNDEFDFEWISNICRKGKETAITIRRILIAEFLAESLDNYFSLDFCKVDKSRIQYDKPNGYEIKIDNYRKRWMNLLESNIYKRNIDMVHADQAAYLWLSRNDNEWLQEHLLDKLKPCGNCTYADWENKDKELAEKIPKIVERILNVGKKPEKITISLVERLLGYSKGYLIKNKRKLKNTMEIVYANIDTTDAFQKRKVDWIFIDVKRNRENIPIWLVLRKAGIRKSKTINEYIQNNYAYLIK